MLLKARSSLHVVLPLANKPEDTGPKAFITNELLGAASTVLEALGLSHVYSANSDQPSIPRSAPIATLKPESQP